MKLIQRIGYYLGGFAIGLIILAFFFNKKKTSCSYGPQARVLKNINSKKIVYSEAIKINDSTLVKQILKKGEINFPKSNARKKPCGLYVIESNYNNNIITLTLQNCDSVVKLIDLQK
ncbi:MULTISPECIES: hypothetical protein [Aestuariivivens]|uniref:hypothetical protein n=1 Tax=Aestuariivivens TaxID=1820275 RepID=UPI001CBF888E|nr:MULTISPECIES: hypothetical protein [Aestuariivivens]